MNRMIIMLTIILFLNVINFFQKRTNTALFQLVSDLVLRKEYLILLYLLLQHQTATIFYILRLTPARPFSIVFHPNTPIKFL
jgi:hypothetical protein